MSNWKTAAIKPNETGHVLFAAILEVNESTSERQSFGAVDPSLSADKFNRVQELAMEILEVMSNG